MKRSIGLLAATAALAASAGASVREALLERDPLPPPSEYDATSNNGGDFKPSGYARIRREARRRRNIRRYTPRH